MAIDPNSPEAECSSLGTTLEMVVTVEDVAVEVPAVPEVPEGEGVAPPQEGKAWRCNPDRSCSPP